MRDNSFRIRIATGAFTLPVMAGVAVLLWLIPGIGDIALWIGLAVVGLTTFLLAELNNRNALLRIRSRLMGATFLALYAACPELHDGSFSMAPMFCLVLGYFQLFSAYQKPHAEGEVFRAFMFLGIASWFYPLLLLIAPVLYFCLLIQLRILTWRTWFAGLMGLMVPYWFYAGWAIWNDVIDTAFLPFVKAFHLTAPDYHSVPMDVLALLIYTSILALLSVFHFTRTAYNDKIRTRMFFYVMICMEALILLACLFQPQHYHVLLQLLIANSAPLIAHYFALARGKVMNYLFNISLLTLGTITIFNYFDLWTLLSISL